MNPFDRMLQRLGLLRVRARGRRDLLQPSVDDGDGDAAAGGVTARLPKVPPLRRRQRPARMQHDIGSQFHRIVPAKILEVDERQ